MNSEVISRNYTNSKEVLYGAHYATLVSEKVTYENPVGKFVLTYATPNEPTGSPYDSTIPSGSGGNVINDDNLGTSSITVSNYVILTVPRYMFYIIDIPIVTNVVGCGKGGIGSCSPKNIIIRKEYFKGQKFVVANAAGNVSAPCIVGVEE